MSDQFPPGGPAGSARACPNCFYSVPYGVPICPNCNTVMPVFSPTLVPPQAPLPKKSNTRLIVAIVLVALIVVGVLASTGYALYQNGQRAADRSAALEAPNKLQSTCVTSTLDNSTLYYSGYAYSGYERFVYVMGIYNPTPYSMDVSLTFTLVFPRVNWNLVSSNSIFRLPSNSLGQAHFAFVISASLLNNLPANPDFSGSTVTLDGTYSVTGTYDTYSVTQHQTVAGSSGTSTLPSC